MRSMNWFCRLFGHDEPYIDGVFILDQCLRCGAELGRCKPLFQDLAEADPQLRMFSMDSKEVLNQSEDWVAKSYLLDS